MTPPELRLIRYFVAVAAEGNVTRAAQRLNIAQPSLSAAIRQLEAQLGVALLERRGRRIAITPAGEQLARRGRELLAHADAVVEAIREADGATGSLRLGLSPTARYGVGPRLLAACAVDAPRIMLYTSEDTTGALIRDLADGRLDLAVTFCASEPSPSGIELHPLEEEPAVVHLPADHPLADRAQLTIADLADETVLVAASHDSAGFSDRVLSAFERAGVTPRTRPDPYPDLGVQAVRERLGIVVYARSAFPADMPGSAFVPLSPPLALPFQLAVRKDTASTLVRTVASIAAPGGTAASARSADAGPPPRANYG